MMNLEMLKNLLAVPSCSHQEHDLVEFIQSHLQAPVTCSTDDWNNVYIRKGAADYFGCVAAHLDSVCLPRPVQIVQQDGTLFGVDEHGQRTGVGADDKAGVFVCLELLERFDNIAVVLFGAEEVGCVGAHHAPAAWFDDVGYVIEFDCPGEGLVSYTSSGTRLFADDGEFIRTATPVLRQHGLTRWQDHPYSDVMALRRRFDFSCLNISCGYHNWHASDEYVVLDEVEAALASGEDLLRALGCHRYQFRSEVPDSAQPQFEITGLQLA